MTNENLYINEVACSHMSAALKGFNLIQDFDIQIDPRVNCGIFTLDQILHSVLVDCNYESSTDKLFYKDNKDNSIDLIYLDETKINTNFKNINVVKCEQTYDEINNYKLITLFIVNTLSHKPVCQINIYQHVNVKDRHTTQLLLEYFTTNDHCTYGQQILLKILEHCGQASLNTLRIRSMKEITECS